jgi:uncharacterized UPF0160 family protein
MKPFHKLTDSEKYKLEKTGLLWELYPEASLYKTAPDSEKDYVKVVIEMPDNPEMVRFIDEVENGDYSLAQFTSDVQKIADAWDKQRQDKRITQAFDELFK